MKYQLVVLTTRQALGHLQQTYLSLGFSNTKAERLLFVSNRQAAFFYRNQNCKITRSIVSGSILPPHIRRER